MKRFLKRRWLGVPASIVTAVLLVVALTGTALAVNGYIFFSGSVNAEVREAIAVGSFDSWDNLHPYGSATEAVWVDTGTHDDGTGVLGDVRITIAPDNGGYVLTIIHSAVTPFIGEGFTPGEWIVIPINLRNGSSVALDLGAAASAVGLELDYCWLTTLGPATETHPDGNLNYNFKDDGNWASLDSWQEQIAGYGGKSGSARIGAQVLFVKITIPQEAIPDTYGDITFSLARGVTVEN